jgi:hypothetical protein
VRLLLHGHGDDLGPLPIIEACNRVDAAIERRIEYRCNHVQRQTERANGREWWKGIAVALSAVLVGLGVVWWMV